MRLWAWLGIALILCWALLWLGIKIAVGAVHLVLLLGITLIVVGLMRQAPARE